jgi:hypothetical protein
MRRTSETIMRAMSDRTSNDGESQRMGTQQGTDDRSRRAGHRLAAAGLLAAGCLWAAALAAPALAAAPESLFIPRATPLTEASPPLPPLGDFPVQLVLDDDTRDGDFGFGGPPARNFLWFEQFTPPGGGFVLEQIWVLFAPGPNMAVGGPIQLAVYLDPDGDPSNGADLLATVDETIQVLDGDTFSIYTLATPIEITTPGDVLIGVVMRNGVVPAPAPAAIDTGSSAGRSWLAVWSTEPPDPPLLAPPGDPDNLLDLVDSVGPAGNWMIRGLGSLPPVAGIPTLDTVGMGLLMLLLGGAALWLLRRRRTLSAGARGLSILLVFAAWFAAAPALAVDIDTFVNDQASLTAPPDSSSSVAAAAAIGNTRDLALSALSGAGPATAAVAGGELTFTLDPSSRGELVATWDGDSDPLTLDPVGLGNVDLTDGGADNSLRLVVEQSDGAAEVLVEIYTDGANSSRLALVLPVVAAQQEFFLPFAAFLPSLGAGADFADVGAVVLTLRDTAAASTIATVISLIDTAGPEVTATKVDTLVSPAPAEPGDTIEYTIEIANDGGDADGVSLEDLLAANPDLTLVPGSLRSTPIARDNLYEACGNVSLSVTGQAGYPNLLTNDSDPDGNNGNPLTITAFDAASVKGGTVSVVDVNTGSFDYDPPPGFQGVDSFTYTLEDDDGNARTATATLIIEETVWFVDNSQPGASLGTFANPFFTLAEAEAASQPGDTIFVFEGLTPATTGQNAGITLKPNQRLIGHGVDLVACGSVIVPASTRPHITNTVGDGIALATDNEIRGLNVGSFAGDAISGTAVGTVTVSDVSVIDAGGAALNIDDGTLAMTFDLLDSLNSGGSGVRLVNVGGTLTATATQIDNPLDSGVVISNAGSATLDFGTTVVTNAGDMGGAGEGVLVTGNAGGTVRFASLSISTENGPGIVAITGGTFDIQATTGVIDANGGPALNVSSTTLRTGATAGWTFDSLESVNSALHGVVLASLADPVTVTTGTNVFDVTGTGILVQNSPSNAFDFGPTQVVDTEIPMEAASGNGIDLATGNAGASFTFDSLTVVTEGGFGLKANNSGTINIGGSTNLIDALGGAALDIANTSLGAGFNFTSLKSEAATVGITLVNTTGAVTVSGQTSIGASATGISLASAGAFQTNTLAVGTSAGTGLITSASGTVTVTNATGSFIMATGGPAMDIAGTPLNVNLTTLSSTNSTARGLSFSGASGSVTAAGGSITGAAGTAFRVSGGSPAVTYGGSVTQNNAQRVVDIENTTGGSVTFQTGTVTGGASSLGVRIANADGNASFADLNLGTSGSPMTSQALTLSGGSAGTFTFADTQIFTSGANGVHADNGGTVEFTGTGNRVSATNGRAITLESGTTIGANGMTLERVDASGSDLGIRLSSAGSGFTVTGTGTTDGSGGTIQNTTQNGALITSTNQISLSNMNFFDAADDGGGAGACSELVFTGCNAAIELATLSTVDLTNLTITGFEDHGIFGQTVTDLDISDTEISGAGADADTNEHGIFVRDLLGTAAGGTDSLFDNVTIDDAQDSAIFVQNSTATNVGNTASPDLLTVSNSSLTDAGDTGLGAQTIAANGNLRIVATGNTVTNTVDGIDLEAVAGDLQGTVGGAGGLTNAISAGVGGDMVNGILFFASAANGASTLDATAVNNSITLDAVKIGGVAPVSGLNGIGVSSSGFSAGNLGTIRATVQGNTINSAFSGVLTQTVHGVITTNEGTGTTSNNVILIDGNVITLNPPAGTMTAETVGVGVDGGTTGAGKTVRITGNTIVANGDASNGASVGIQILPTELGDPVNTGTRVCVRVTGNTVSTPNNPFAVPFMTTQLDVIAAPVVAGSFLDVEAIPVGARTTAQLKADLEPLNTSTEVGDPGGAVAGTITGVASCPN